MAPQTTVVDYVYAAFRPFDELWVDSETRVWISLADKNLKEMVDATIATIKDQNVPKNLLIIFFQKFIGGCDINLIKDYMREIVDAAKAQKWNKVCFGTCYFPPQHEVVWGIIALYNREAHRCNEALGRPRVNIHRAMMSQVSETDKTLRTRPSMWAEYQLGLHLGLHPSYEGLRNIVNLINKVLDTAFKYQSRSNNSRPSVETRVVIPPTLAITPGYPRNTFMRQLLVDRGTMQADPSMRGQRRLHMSEQKLPGWRSWQIYKRNGPLRRFNEREGLLAAIDYLQKRADAVPTWSNEDEEDYVVVNHEDDDEGSWTSDENLEIRIINYEQEEDEEVSRQVREMDIEEAYDPEDPVVDDFEELPSVADSADKEDTTETEVERNCNERQELTMAEALAKIDLTERIYVVEQEKVKTYQAMIEKKEEKIDTLEAEVKAKKESIEYLEATVKYLKGKLESDVKAKDERIDYLESSIKYLKNVYKAKASNGGKRS